MKGDRRDGPIFSFFFFLFLFCCEVASEISASREHTNANVQGVIGGVVKIPCKALSDNVNLVIWSKKDADIYTLDARNVPLVKGDHMRGESRINFMPLENPSYLLLNDLKEEDEGTYTCFIIYKNQLSETLKTSLKIIVPPASIKIFDSKLEELQTKSNELQENSTAEFTCQVTGGRPAPIITWWKGAVLLDNKVDDEGTQVLRNRLQYGPLTRDDQDVDLVCQASNSNLTSPLNKKITLDINFPPLTAEIITQDTPLVADSEFTIICKSSGAKPPAIITWLLDDKVLNTTRDFTINNGKTTQSELKFIPTKEDGGKTLTCKAESTVLLTKPLTDKRLLDIHYPPIAKLSIEPEGEIIEGSDVVLTCDVTSNPEASDITWYHRGQKIEVNATKKIRMEKNSLFLSSVTRKMTGVYTCIATNLVSIGESNAQALLVRYVPVCSESKPEIVGASLQEEIKVYCNLKAHPDVNSFRWEYSSTLETFDIVDSFTSEEKRSVLRYKPKTRKDFGRLKCWGTNELGEQVKPCEFLVVEAGFPEKPENCTFLGNYTSSSVFVRCYEGHDGGLPQSFIAEVLDMQKNVITRNVSSSDPFFAIENLPPGTDFLLTIYSANGKGPSEKQVLQVYTAVPTEKGLYSINSTHEFPITPILGVLIGVVGAIVIVFIIVVVISKLRSVPADKKNLKDDVNGVRAPLHPRDGGEAGPDSSNERPDSLLNEDGIPNKLKHANLYETVAYETPDGLKDSEILSNRSWEKDSGDDVEYAELNFSDKRSKKSQKSKGSKKSSKSNGKIHSSHDPTLYVSIDHVQTEKKKLQQQQQQQQQQQRQQQEHQPLQNQNEETKEIYSPHPLKNLNEPQVTNFDAFPQHSPPSSHSSVKTDPPPPSAPQLQSILRQPEKRQAPIPLESPTRSKGQEIATKKPSTKPTNLDKPPIAKKPVFVQDLKKNKRSAETQTENEQAKDDIPLMDSAVESSL